MRVSTHRPRRAFIAAAVTALVVALPATASAAEAPLAACDDLLTTLTPTGIAGDATAAAVTAQVLDADVPGWASVTWSVPEATHLRDVLVLGGDGQTRGIGAQRSGTATGVLALGFCGTTGDVANDAGTDERSTPPASTAETAPAPAVVPEPAPAPEPTPAPEPSPVDEPVAEIAATDVPTADEPDGTADDAVEDGTSAATGGPAGPIGPSTAPFHDAVRHGEVTRAVRATVAAPAPDVLPVAPLASVTSVDVVAATTGANAATVTNGPAMDRGLGVTLLTVTLAGAAALAALANRQRPTSEVRA